MGGGRWNPWRELRARKHIELEWTLLRGDRGQWIPHPNGTATIHLDPRLSQRERRCVLAHELIHDERGITYTRSTPEALVAAEERWVWRETARRLVPAGELEQLIAAADPVPLELWELCDHFDVDQRIATLAAQLRRIDRLAA